MVGSFCFYYSGTGWQLQVFFPFFANMCAFRLKMCIFACACLIFHRGTVTMI